MCQFSAGVWTICISVNSSFAAAGGESRWSLVNRLVACASTRRLAHPKPVATVRQQHLSLRLYVSALKMVLPHLAGLLFAGQWLTPLTYTLACTALLPRAWTVTSVRLALARTSCRRHSATIISSGLGRSSKRIRGDSAASTPCYLTMTTAFSPNSSFHNI